VLKRFYGINERKLKVDISNRNIQLYQNSEFKDQAHVFNNQGVVPINRDWAHEGPAHATTI
jgi:hypothetical protein